MPEELISVIQAGEILGCSRDTVRWLIQKGDLTPFVPPHTGQKPRRLFLQRSQVERLKSQPGGWRTYKQRRS